MMRFLIILLFFFPLAGLAVESGQLLVDTELLQEPFADAKSLAKLKTNTAVEVLKRQGGWMRVKPAEGAEGWVKLSAIKLGGSGTPAKGDSGLGALWNSASQGRSGNTGVTVATGVRGLTPEDMKNAKPAPEEVKKLDSFAATKGQAESSARSAKLSKQSVEYLTDAAGGKK